MRVGIFAALISFLAVFLYCKKYNSCFPTLFKSHIMSIFTAICAVKQFIQMQEEKGKTYATIQRDLDWVREYYADR